MAKQLINLGVSTNDGTGDTLRVGAQKINDNFNELYNALSYTLPIATPGRLGGVKIGNNIDQDADGVISVTFPTAPTASTSTLGVVKVDGLSITISDGVISAVPSAYVLPTATTQALGGVKVDGSSITINNGVISATASTYNLPIATGSVLGGIKVGSRLTITDGVLSADAQSYTLPVATGSVLGGIKVGSRLTITDGVLSANDQSYTLPTASESTLGGVKVDGSSITIVGGVISASASANVSRITASGTSDSISIGTSGTFNIVGYKAYALLKIYVSGAAWVTLYTDNAARTADSSRLETEDPLPGSGVIAEVITTGEDTILISPGTIGFNNEGSPTTTIPVKVVNKGVAPAAITVTLTILKLED